MQSNTKITPFQFYNILFLSRIFASITYIAGLQNQLSPSASLAMAAVTAVYLALTAIPSFLLLVKDTESSITVRASCVSKVLGKIICVIYFLDFLYYGAITAARFELLASSVMFPEKDMTFFVLIILAASAYAAFNGIEALGRAGVLFLVPLIFSFLFVFSSTAKNFDVLNFTPLSLSESENIFKAGLYTAARTGELLAVPIMTPYIRNQKKRHIFIWIIALSSIIIIMALFVSGVLGLFGNTQLFSMYSMSVLAKFSFIQRLDAIITCIWMLCAGIKLSFIFFVSDEIITSITGKRHRVLNLIITVVLIFGGMFAMTRSISSFAKLVTSPTTVIIYLISAVVIPLIVIIGEKIKGVGKKCKS